MSVFQNLGSFIVRCFKMFILSGAAVLGVMTTIILVIVVLAAMSAGAASDPSNASKFAERTVEYGADDAEKTFLAINVSGVILGERSGISELGSLFEDGLTYGYEVKEHLMEAAEDEDISGVLLVIDSPGGTIFGSQAIADGVAYYREKTNKPIFTYVSGMAASGGYWTAVSTDHIIADHGTAVGSIGVIFGPFKYYDTVISEDGGAFVGGVVTQGGIETTYVTAGKSKDLGNPSRRVTPEELEKLQLSVNDSYSDFVKMVSLHRSISDATIRDEIGAMIYGENQALKLKLIDEVGNKHDAFKALAAKAGVEEGKYKIVRELPANDFMSALFGATFKSKTPETTSPLCTMNSQILAFHGSVATLCP